MHGILRRRRPPAFKLLQGQKVDAEHVDEVAEGRVGMLADPLPAGLLPAFEPFVPGRLSGRRPFLGGELGEFSWRWG